MKWIYLLLFFSPLFLFSKENEEATYILGKVTTFHKNNPKMMGNFTLSVNGKPSTGIFYYYSNNNNQSVKLFFGPEDMDSIGQEKFSYWVVDKNKLWIYLSDTKVLVEQEIPEYFRTIGILGTGLSHYFADYKKFSLEEIKEKDPKGNENIIKKLIFSEPVKEKTAFSSVILEITDEGFQRATIAISSESQDKKENTFSFRLDNVKFDSSFDEKNIFRVVPGGSTQILRNVLMPNS